MIIGISGKMQSGKDTVACIIQAIDYMTKYGDKPILRSYYQDYLKEAKSWKIHHFADPVREVVALMTGMPAELLKRNRYKRTSAGHHWNFMTYRELLQKVGTDAIRDNVHENAWVNALMQKYDSRHKWIIADCRFENEAEAIKKEGGVVIRVERQNEQTNSHISETALDGWQFDAYILNTHTIEYLIDRIATFLLNFKLIPPKTFKESYVKSVIQIVNDVH